MVVTGGAVVVAVTGGAVVVTGGAVVVTGGAVTVVVVEVGSPHADKSNDTSKIAVTIGTIQSLLFTTFILLNYYIYIITHIQTKAVPSHFLDQPHLNDNNVQTKRYQ